MKSYLDGKIKLNDPTFGKLCQIGQLLKTYDASDLTGGMATPKLIAITCEIAEGFDIDKDLPPGTAITLVEDIFDTWKPLQWIKENVKTMEKNMPKDSKPIEDDKALSSALYLFGYILDKSKTIEEARLKYGHFLASEGKEIPDGFPNKKIKTTLPDPNQGETVTKA